MRIESGSNGNTVEVDNEGRLRAFVDTQPQDRHLASKGKVWSLYDSTTPSGATYLFYLKNTGDTELHITDIRIMCATADTFTYEKVIGTPAFTAGVDITPTNRNFTHGDVPDATIKKDTSVTGLTSGGVVFFERCAVADTIYHLRTSSNIHIPQGGSFAIKAGTGTALTTFVVSLIEDNSSTRV